MDVRNQLDALETLTPGKDLLSHGMLDGSQTQSTIKILAI